MLDLLTVESEFTRPACRAAAAAIDRYLLPAPDLSSKPTGRRRCCRLTGQTDGQTDRPTLNERCLTLTDRAVTITKKKLYGTKRRKQKE